MKTGRELNMLQDVISWFGEDYKNRCSVEDTLFSPRCLYNPPKSKTTSIGCAIGMYLTKEVAKKLDKVYWGDIRRIFKSKHLNLLPKWMQEMDVDFLKDLQVLHDAVRNWNRNRQGLSKDGKQFVKTICEKHKIPFEKLIL